MNNDSNKNGQFIKRRIAYTFTTQIYYIIMIHDEE